MLNYLKWCWRMKEVLRWQVALVSDEPLTQEQYDYPEIWVAEHGAHWTVGGQEYFLDAYP